jgi:DNA mismatch endonuclease (patch repair protein)
MRRIKSAGTKPELVIRSLVHRLGYRFRLHARDLPGKPDLVFRPKQKVIFVHGCFWHSHDRTGCLDSRIPKTNKGYWIPKLTRNKARDEENAVALQAAGWEVLVIWDCETNNEAALSKRIKKFLR